MKKILIGTHNKGKFKEISYLLPRIEKKMYEDKDDEQSKKILQSLEQKYTLGKVNFDSVIIIDFGNSLKSVLTSLVFY